MPLEIGQVFNRYRNSAFVADTTTDIEENYRPFVGYYLQENCKSDDFKLKFRRVKLIKKC